VVGSSPGLLGWGQGPQELRDSADGSPDHRRRVVRLGPDDAGQDAAAVALLPQEGVRAANGLMERKWVVPDGFQLELGAMASSRRQLPCRDGSHSTEQKHQGTRGHHEQIATCEASGATRRNEM
jgi:hypothetical protein